MKKRIQYIDHAKGLAILLMVLGHIEIPEILKSEIYAFHMPLFFIVSGYFFKPELSIVDESKKLCRSLLMPYFVIAAFIRFIQFFSNHFNGLPIDVTDIITLPLVAWKLNGPMESSGAIWFLVALFNAKLMMRYLHNKRCGVAILMFLASLSICFSLFTGIVLPFCVQQGLMGSIFLYIGYQLKKNAVFDIVELQPWSVLLTSLFVVAIWGSKVGVAMRANGYGLGLFNILTSSVISILVILLMKRLEELHSKPITLLNNFLIWCGRYSLIILCVHSIEIRFVEVYFDSQLSFVLEFLIRIGYISVITWFILKINVLRKLFNVNN